MNNEINFQPFYIGQKIIAVKDFANGSKGDEFTVESINGFSFCPTCKKETYDVKLNGIVGRTFCHLLFAPIYENFQSISLEKVLEKETPLISVN